MRPLRAHSSPSSPGQTVNASWLATASCRLAASAVAIALSACAGSAPPPAPPAPAPQPAKVSQPAVPSEPAWLGVWFDPGTTRVIQVISSSPAATAGVQIGDELVSLDGIPVRASQEIVKAVTEAAPGHRMTIALTRGGKPLTVVATLGTRPNDEQLIQKALLDKPAPAFTATSLDGSPPLTLAALRGNVVLVDFWATWCGPCTLQFPHLNDWHREYASKGLRIVALSDEEPDLVREYVASEKLTYPIALDPDDEIRAAYLVPGMPTTVIIDKAGIVRYVRVGAADPVEIESAITQLLK